MSSVALQGKAMIVNLVSLVNELVNGLHGQRKMVNVIKLITAGILFSLISPDTSFVYLSKFKVSII